MLCWITVTSLLLIWGTRQYFQVRATLATSSTIYAVLMPAKHVSLYQRDDWLCKFARLICLMFVCESIRTCDKLQQRALTSFLRARICDPFTFTHCICWVSKSLRHYWNHYFCSTGPLQSTVSSKLTTRGIRTLRNCLSISCWRVCQHSRVLITRRALAVTWETNRNKTIFIVLKILHSKYDEV